VRTSHLERTCVLPGDELIPEPIGTLTHAITIRRPAREVWPWLGAENTLRSRDLASAVLFERRVLLIGDES
ncbi:MAG TPA: hypothetical protein VE505_19775, partial [Vicinamibacterales bacterium]|nr:hypothetical protein [Vicinamibacterales bacterium]